MEPMYNDATAAATPPATSPSTGISTRPRSRRLRSGGYIAKLFTALTSSRRDEEKENHKPADEADWTDDDDASMASDVAAGEQAGNNDEGTSLTDDIPIVTMEDLIKQGVFDEYDEYGDTHDAEIEDSEATDDAPDGSIHDDTNEAEDAMGVEQQLLRFPPHQVVTH